MKVTSSDPTPYQTLLRDNIQGNQVAFNDTNISDVADEAYIRKTYKLPVPSKGSSASDQARLREDLELSILGLMALRGAN